MEIEEQMVAWGEEIARRLSSTRNCPLPLEVHVKVDEYAQIALLEALGFEQQPAARFPYLVPSLNPFQRRISLLAS